MEQGPWIWSRTHSKAQSSVANDTQTATASDTTTAKQLTKDLGEGTSLTSQLCEMYLRASLQPFNLWIRELSSTEHTGHIGALFHHSSS